MTVSADRTELPQTGRTWITLIVSTIALLMLVAWSLRNPNKLLRHSVFSAPVATVEQSESESQLDNGAAEKEVDATTTTDIAQVVTVDGNRVDGNRAGVNEKGEPDAAALEVAEPGAVAVAPDQQGAGIKSAEDDAESRPAAQLAAAQVADRESSEKTNAKTASEDSSVAENVEPEQTARQQSASQTPETVETAQKNARQLAAERLAAVQSDRLVTESSFAAKLAKEKQAVDKALSEKLAEEKAIKDEAANEIAAAKTAAAKKAAEEQAAAEQAAAERAAAAEQAAAEKAAEEKAAEEKAIADSNARAQNPEPENQAAEQLAALPSTGLNDAARAVVPENETAFEKSRREDLAKLPELAARIRFAELAARIRFANNDTETTGDSKQLMDRMFELLFLYSETDVTVQVASNEYQLDDTNQLISRLRSLVIINYLIKRGLDEGRFKVRALGKQGLSFNSHQVSVVATVIENGE